MESLHACTRYPSSYARRRDRLLVVACVDPRRSDRSRRLQHSLVTEGVITVAAVRLPSPVSRSAMLQRRGDGDEQRRPADPLRHRRVVLQRHLHCRHFERWPGDRAGEWAPPACGRRVRESPARARSRSPIPCPPLVVLSRRVAGRRRRASSSSPLRSPLTPVARSQATRSRGLHRHSLCHGVVDGGRRRAGSGTAKIVALATGVADTAVVSVSVAAIADVSARRVATLTSGSTT